MFSGVRVEVDEKKKDPKEKHVLSSVKQFPNYGKLSQRKGNELFSGVRVEVDEKKKDPRDFALWKSCKTQKEPGWGSPWGRGRLAHRMHLHDFFSIGKQY